MTEHNRTLRHPDAGSAPTIRPPILTSDELGDVDRLAALLWGALGHEDKVALIGADSLPTAALGPLLQPLESSLRCLIEARR